MASLPDTTPDRAYGSPSPESPAAPQFRVSPLHAVARHPFVTILPILVGVAAALVIGLTRQPVYKAQARMGIITVNVEAPGALAGFGTGAGQLAQAYARTLSVPEIRSAVARRTRVPEERLDSRLSAAAVPNAPIFSVRATGQSPRAAVDLANVTSQELVRYVGAINSTSRRSQSLLDRYQDTQRELQDAITRRDGAERAYAAGKTSARRRRVIQMRADVEVAKTRANALQVAYQQSLTGADSGDLVRILSTATKATSDRGSTLQMLLFLGVVAGAAVGVALALLLTAHEARRAFADVGSTGGRRRRAYAAGALVIVVLAGAGYAVWAGGWPPW